MPQRGAYLARFFARHGTLNGDYGRPTLPDSGQPGNKMAANPRGGGQRFPTLTVVEDSRVRASHS